MAASGGYMLAMGCDKVVCSKYAIIGSVGVIAQLYNWSGLNEKLGLEEKTFTTGSHKNPFPMGAPYSQEDTDRMRELIQETFEVFKDIVLGSRKFTPEQIEQITKAKTFHGFQAIGLGMVDELSMGHDYLDNLDKQGHCIWMCSKETKSKSIVNSLFYSSTKNIIGLVQNSFKNNILDKKVNSVKLL
jgi:ClpP class serine protease